jgi:hypothetical protein
MTYCKSLCNELFVKTYFMLIYSLRMNPKISAIIVWDFSRLDGAGETGGITLQDLIIHLYIPDGEDPTSFTSEAFHYIPNEIDSVADEDFVGSAFTEFINELLQKLPNLQKLYIWSDGGNAHFRSHWGQSMMFYKCQDEFPDIIVEWHMFVSNHGHGPADGDAAAVKKSITRKYRLTLTTLRNVRDFADHIESVGERHKARPIDISVQSKGDSELPGIKSVQKFTYDTDRGVIRGYEDSSKLAPLHVWDPE